MQLLPALIVLFALAPPAKGGSSSDRLPGRLSWGPYTVVVEPVGKGYAATARLRILDKRGAIVREIDDQQFTLVEPTSLRKGERDLHVAAYTGGAHCCTTDYYFTRTGGVRNLLIYYGGNGGVGDEKDLDGDGVKEIIAQNDCLAYFGNLSYAASPSLVTILEWDGRRYVDRTGRFPARALANAREFKSQLITSLNKTDDTAEDERRYGAAGYYGTMLTLGRGDAALRYLNEALPKTTRRWLASNAAALRAAVAGSKKKATISQRRVLKAAL